MASVVSVIIPTFDRVVVVGQAIDSVLAQTHSVLEVIVVDDGSTDGTAELVAGRAAQDARVRYHRQANAGAAAARNAGLDLAAGDVVAFLDSDDFWRPWHVELMLAGLDHKPEVGLIWADLDFIDQHGAVVQQDALKDLLGAWRHFPLRELFPESVPLASLGVSLPPGQDAARLYTGTVFSAMVIGNLIVATTTVMRRELIDQSGRFDETLPVAEDYEFLLRASRIGPVAFASIADAGYRIGTADKLSAAADGRPMAEAYLAILERTLARDAAGINLPSSLIDHARADAERWVGERELVAGARRTARSHLRRSISIRPWQPTIVPLIALSFAPVGVVQGAVRARRSVLRSSRPGLRRRA